jgi:DNA-binding IclR family transcriptional regulator
LIQQSGGTEITNDDGHSPSADADERLGIQSVEVAAEILSALVDGGGLLQLKDISAATGMHRGKVHRYLTSLTRSGLLFQDDKGTYGIGALALSLGLTALRRLDPVRIAYHELPKLSDELKETAIVAIWGEWGPTVIALQESPWPITLNVRAGSVLPLKTSATGQVFEAFLPQEALDAFERRQTATGKSPSFAINRKKNETRVRGLARADESVLPGINALAAPVFDHTGKLCLVVGVVGRKETLDIDWNSKAAKRLRSFATDLSLKLGHTDPNSQGRSPGSAGEAAKV